MPISPNGWKALGLDNSPPRPPPSAKTLTEMYAGRRQLQIAKYRETMPVGAFRKFLVWVHDFKPPPQKR